MSYLKSSRCPILFSLQKQNMIASKIFDLPAPLGPMMEVIPRNGPTYFLSQLAKWLPYVLKLVRIIESNFETGGRFISSEGRLS